MAGLFGWLAEGNADRAASTAWSEGFSRHVGDRLRAEDRVRHGCIAFNVGLCCACDFAGALTGVSRVGSGSGPGNLLRWKEA